MPLIGKGHVNSIRFAHVIYINCAPVQSTLKPQVSGNDCSIRVFCSKCTFLFKYLNGVL